MCARESGIARQCRLIQLDGAPQVVFPAALPDGPRLQVELVGFDVLGRRRVALRKLLFPGREFDLELIDDCSRDLVLHREDVRHPPVVGFRPEVKA